MIALTSASLWHNDALAGEDLEERISALYQKVYEDPSNVGLNLELVRTQILIRDYKGASGTLERLLIIAPDNIAAQLLMAQVKIALKNFSEAKVILVNVIDDRTVDAINKRRAETLLQTIDQLTDGLSWQASVETNLGISQNPENKPSKTAYSLYLPTTPIDVSGASQEFRSITASGTLEQRFNSYDATSLRLDLSHQRRDYNSYNKSDYEVYSAAAAVIRGDKAPLGGTVRLMRVRVRERDFMDQIGLESRKNITAPFGIQLAGTAYLGRQTHRAHVNFSGNEKKTGMIGKLSLSGTMMLGQRAIRASLGYDRKQAVDSRYAFHQTKLSFDTNLPLFGMNLLGQASIARKRYDASSMTFSTKRRRDNIANIAVEMVLPVAQSIKKFAPNMRLSMRGDVNRTFSNIDRYNTTKSEVMLKASYAWQGR